jgi:hypothetical protein
MHGAMLIGCLCLSRCLWKHSFTHGSCQRSLGYAASHPFSYHGCMLSNAPVDMAKYIVDHVSSDAINAGNDFGNTPLHWCSLNGHLDLLKFLVEHGGDTKVRLSHFCYLFSLKGNLVIMVDQEQRRKIPVIWCTN